MFWLEKKLYSKLVAILMLSLCLSSFFTSLPVFAQNYPDSNNITSPSRSSGTAGTSPASSQTSMGVSLPTAITRDSQFTLTTSGEPNSDIEYNQYNPKYNFNYLNNTPALNCHEDFALAVPLRLECTNITNSLIQTSEKLRIPKVKGAKQLGIATTANLNLPTQADCFNPNSSNCDDQTRTDVQNFGKNRYTLSGVNPQDGNQYTKLTRNSTNGGTDTTFNLGENIRDDNGLGGDVKNSTCVKMDGPLGNNPTAPIADNTRRIGICSDGLYTLKTREVDTAGNLGSWITNVIERDTVSPTTPVVKASKTGDILGEFLSLDITGESFTKGKVEVIEDSNYQTPTKTIDIDLNSNGKYISTNLIGQLNCGEVTYSVKVTLTDRAGNISTTSTSNTITTLPCPVCGSNGSGQFGLPIASTRFKISGEYPRYKITSGLPHAGIDFAADFNTPIIASQTGTVKRLIFSYTDNYGKEDPFNSGGWANIVIIEHEGRLQSIYAHLAPNNMTHFC